MVDKDELICMAKEAGWQYVNGDDGYAPLWKFAALVAAAEREECAKLMKTLTCMGDAKECFEVAATYIRARGQK